MYLKIWCTPIFLIISAVNCKTKRETIGFWQLWGGPFRWLRADLLGAVGSQEAGGWRLSGSDFLWLKRCHKLAMTGNANHTTYIPPIKMVMTGGWFYGFFLNHITYFWLVWQTDTPRDLAECHHITMFLPNPPMWLEEMTSWLISGIIQIYRMEICWLPTITILLLYNIYIYIHMHTHRHTYTHIYTYTYIHMHTHAYTYPHIYTYTNILIYTYTRIRIYKYTYTHIYTYTYTNIQIHTYTRIRIYKYTHTHIHACVHACMHAYIYIYIYTYKNIYTCKNIYMYLHIYIYVCIFIYIHDQC